MSTINFTQLQTTSTPLPTDRRYYAYAPYGTTGIALFYLDTANKLIKRQNFNVVPASNDLYVPAYTTVVTLTGNYTCYEMQSDLQTFTTTTINMSSLTVIEMVDFLDLAGAYKTIIKTNLGTLFVQFGTINNIVFLKNFYPSFCCFAGTIQTVGGGHYSPIENDTSIPDRIRNTTTFYISNSGAISLAFSYFVNDLHVVDNSTRIKVRYSSEEVMTIFSHVVLNESTGLIISSGYTHTPDYTKAKLLYVEPNYHITFIDKDKYIIVDGTYTSFKMYSMSGTTDGKNGSYLFDITGLPTGSDITKIARIMSF